MSSDNTDEKLTVGLVLKMPGRRAVVVSRTMAGKPWPHTVERMASEMIAAEYNMANSPNPYPVHKDGTVDCVGDLIAELFNLLGDLPDGPGQGVAFEKHGVRFGITNVEFDPYMPATADYDEDGSDLVLLTGPND